MPSSSSKKSGASVCPSAEQVTKKSLAKTATPVKSQALQNQDEQKDGSHAQMKTPTNPGSLLELFKKEATPQKGSQLGSQRSVVSANKTGSALKQGSLMNFVKK